VTVATIHLVDDDEPFLRATSRLLRALGFAVKTYPSADVFLAGGEVDGPGCIILDLNMPGMNGLELQKALLAREEMLPVIFLTGGGSVPSSVAAMKAGAVDFLEKRAPREELQNAVERAIAKGELERAEKTRRRETKARLSALTEREREILEYVVAGKMNKEIAADLDIHERTVKLHRTAITTKLRVQSVAELTRLWLESGERVRRS
jgi:FixJ family two-component response regulator